MLVWEPFFRGFTGKETADTSKSSEVMGLSTENMAQVDELAVKLCKPGAQALGRTGG